jgi:hypothetical protein
MSRPRWNEFEKRIGIQEDVGGLPDVWRISPLSLKFPDGRAKPDTIILDEDKQHYLLASAVAYYRGYKFESREDYYDWFRTAPVWYAEQMTSATTKYRSHTNKMGLDNRRNYLLKINMDLDLPKFGQLITGWASLNPILQNGELKVRNIFGIKCVAFECINANEDYWRYNPIDHPHLFDVPLITGRYTEGGVVKLPLRDNIHIPYPQFSGRFVFPMWMPFDSEAYIPVEQVRMSDDTTKIWIR